VKKDNGKIIILLGAPGAGKGTQAHMLENRCKLLQISTGDILRTIAKMDTDLGREVARVQRAGDLVSDAVLADVVRDRTAKADCDGGYILDGFPRTITQAEMLEGLAEEQRHEIKAVYVRLERVELMRRITGRRICPMCNEIYNIYTRPPRRDGLCDNHETDVELIHRNDDREEVVANRINKWAEMTKPVYDYYRSTGRLATVNAAAPVEEVFEAICAALGVRI
jgi:adenylate kinase